MNSYYIAKMISSSDAEEAKVGKEIGVLFPENTHLNLSFGAVTKNAKNEENAVALLEYLTEEKAQKELSEEKIDAYLVVSTENDKINGMLYSENSLGQSTQLLIQQQLTGLQSMLRASQLGISPEEVASLSQQASLTRQKVNFDSKGKMTVGEDNSTVQYVVSYV
ncbi:ABC transporter permease, partial [Enterococcus faecalis]|nr:ABC transporter permease [Enterococcus faecalis]